MTVFGYSRKKQSQKAIKFLVLTYRSTGKEYMKQILLCRMNVSESCKQYTLL